MKLGWLDMRVVIASMSIVFGISTVTPLIAGPDIDVVYISRTPRYNRYNVTYTRNIDPLDGGNSRPSLSEEEQAKKRWPAKGEQVTFTAVMKNPGDQPTGAFSYKWYFDGKEVESGTLPSIEPRGTTSTSYKWTWDSEWNDHYIKFVADPDNEIAEEIETNNVVEDRTNALCYRFHCHQSLYDWMLTEARKINPDIATFEDWCQYQMRLMNQCFAEAIYPTSPEGILERVRVDEVVVEPDHEVTHQASDWQWDGQWHYNIDAIKIFTENPDFIKGIYTWGLHEHSHQLGMIDLYQLDKGLDPVTNEIKPKIGHVNTRGFCVMATSGATHYSDHTANAFNSNLHKRRGYYGEFLYDLPTTCKVRLIDAYRNPIPNATIKFYQAQAGKFKEEFLPFVGTTDENGMFTMPNRSCLGSVVTATGHILHDNPWGMIHVVGFNGVFLCEITANGQTDYQHLEILPFNLAYAQGHKDSWTYNLQSSIIQDGPVTTEDLNGIKMVSKTSGYAVGNSGTVLQYDGKNWSKVATPTTVSLKAVDVAKDGKLICAVGDQGNVLLCENGKWAQIKLETDHNLRTCAVVSPTTLLVGGDFGSLYRTTDGGANWTSVQVTDKTVRSIRFIDLKNGVLTCNAGRIFYTSDGGDTWTEATGIPGTGDITACSVAAGNETWACSDNGEVYKSADGGKKWSLVNQFGYAWPWQTIDMTEGGNGWVLGRPHSFINRTTVLRFSNNYWGMEPVTTFENKDTFNSVSIVSDEAAWAVGKGGLILYLVGGNQ